MNKRASYLLLALALLAALALTQCKPAATPTPTTAPAKAGEAATPTSPPPPKEVKIVYWEQEGDEVDVFLDELVNKFMEEHPNITVERVHYGNEELRDQFQTAGLAGAAPELVRVPNDFAGPFSSLQLILPVDEVFDKAFLDTLDPLAIQASRVAGVDWGVPDNYGNHLMLLYNKDLVSEPPKTTDELIEMAKGLTKDEDGDGEPDQWGFAYNLNEPFWLAPWIGGFGGWPLNEKDEPDLGSEAVVKALQFVHDLKWVHKIVPVECDYNCADTLFKEGKAAMIINGDWSLGGYAEALGDKLGVAPIPEIPGYGWPSPMTSGKYWMVSKQVKDDPDKLAAVKTFVEYMCSKEVQKQWLEKFKRLPSNKELQNDPAITSDPILAGSMAQLQKGRGMPAAPEMRCAWDAMRPNLEAVMADSTTPEEAAAKMQDEATRCVQEMRGG